jgi:hypothetical protein
MQRCKPPAESVELMARASHQTDAFSFHPVITCQCFPNAKKTYQKKTSRSDSTLVIIKFPCISIGIWNGYPFHCPTYWITFVNQNEKKEYRHASDKQGHKVITEFESNTYYHTSYIRC